MAADGSVIIDTRMDTSGVQNGVSAIRQSFNGLGSVVKKIGVLIGGAFAIGKLAQFGKECVELGSNLTEVQNVVDVTFTTMSDKVNEFAKNAMTSAGLSETMAKRYVGTFGAMSKSFGFSEAQAYDMSTALTQLTGDVASFYNISQDEAYTKLKSVFTGETETLKDLGVVLTQNALDQYALANGYGKTTSEMTKQEKVALRLAFVQKQLSAASGDFIRTSDSWANQVRVMKLQLQSLKATVGQGLINLFTPVLKVINILLGKLATLANAFKSFTELITGKKSSGQTGVSGAGLAGTDAIADTADQYGNAADNAEKLADATNDTADATKKADDIKNLERMGEKSADNIIKGIAASKEVPFERVLFALGIRFVGETVAKKIAKSFRDIEELEDADLEKLKNIDEIGEKIAQSIILYFANPSNRELVNRLKTAGLQFFQKEEDLSGYTDKLAGQSIVISGVFAHHSRDEYKDLIEKNGGKNVGSISAKTSFILAGENMGPAKLEKAQKLGVKIMSEEEFLALIS